MPSPTTLPELLSRARGLAGMSIAELAKALHYRVPTDQRGHKGYVGQLVELGLGACAGSDPEPDFPALGVELKTLPVSEQGRPAESTYVCMARLDGREALRFDESYVGKKLAKVLFVPVVEVSPTLAERRFGMPFFWEPDATDRARLEADFANLAGRVRLGESDEVSAHEGAILQLRPKGMSRDETTLGLSAEGWLVQVRPRGWYLRPTFTAELLGRAFARTPTS